jgi:hypothetical protein
VTARRGWWRENRWWLPALPVALAAMLAASAYNVRDSWYYTGFHHELASADQGEFVQVTQGYEDAEGQTSRTFRVRLDGFTYRTTYQLTVDGPEQVKVGQQALVVHLDWEADPDQAIRTCMVTLVDDEGRRYEEVAGTYQPDQCTPEGRGGPEPAQFKGDERGAIPSDELPRPPVWSTDPVFLLPGDVRITQVWLTWGQPDYVSLHAS